MDSKRKADAELRAFSGLGKYLVWVALILVGIMSVMVSSLAGLSLPDLNRVRKDHMPMGKEILSKTKKQTTQTPLWTPPDTTEISGKAEGELIRYGKNLIASTSKFLGPNGAIGRFSNNMNCQNCHLEGGTKPFANNFSVFYESYPKMSARSGRKEDAFERVNECLERSMNGRALAQDSKEMQAILAYLKWVGATNRSRRTSPDESVKKVPYMSTPADPVRGKIVYNTRCSSCHGGEGSGTLNAGGNGYIYPPLWGAESYNDGAGMYRLINFAGFVKNNMPLGTTYQAPLLSDEEAWDVAAYVNSRPRPHFDQRNDYKKLSTKPLDYPFAPYADGFSATQHKFGPFIEIAKQQQLKQKK